MRWWGAVAATGLALALAGCGFFAKKPAPIAAEPGATQTGVASWYGPGFHGRRTANGEIYDQYQLTAAHRTLPHGTRVEVTNLSNGRAVRVRINDRGPYVDDRVIDLSYTAAQRLGMIGPGTAPVRIEVLPAGAMGEAPPILAAPRPAPRPAPLAPAAPPRAVALTAPPRAPEPEADPPGARYSVQAGTYADYARARRAQQRLDAEGERAHLAMIDAPDARYYQVRVGPFSRRTEADRVAQRLSALGMPALVVWAGLGR
ncbi:MAG: septal ring lytic transglycosylase RlpA family protein [Deltaproteobacteria bacterium]|nr:septal ring lytic transglycosylase RlpA family protein [Deltaproteobacteria bacterium]